MKMRLALAASIVLNLILVAGVVHYGRRAKWPKPLPAEKPDFARIKLALQEKLADPANAELFELMDFKAREWLCRANLRDKFDKPSRAHWENARCIVNEVSALCNVPGRTAGWVFDPADPRRLIGLTIEFGYSIEVGYELRNEFMGIPVLVQGKPVVPCPPEEPHPDGRDALEE